MDELHIIILFLLLFGNVLSYHWGKYVEDYKIKKFLLSDRFHKGIYSEYKEWIKENEDDFND